MFIRKLTKHEIYRKNLVFKIKYEKQTNNNNNLTTNTRSSKYNKQIFKMSTVSIYAKKNISLHKYDF